MSIGIGETMFPPNYVGEIMFRVILLRFWVLLTG